MNRWSRHFVVVWLLVVLASLDVRAGDSLDSLKGRGWSPNGQWLAFNPVNQNYLYIASMTGRRNFIIRPLGQVVLDTSNMFTSSPVTNRTSAGGTPEGDGVTMTIGSPGTSKLEVSEWSPNNEFLAYSFERKMRATFSVTEKSVVDTYSISNSLPWSKPEDWRVIFEFERPSTNPPVHPAQYAMRVVRPDNSVVKECLFQDQRELQRISLLRNSGSTFLTPDHQRLIYPKRSEKGWQLMTDSATGPSAPVPLTEPAPGAPYEWKMSPDGHTLAVIEGSSAMTIGSMDDWSKAERLTYSNLTLTVAWSTDSRYLACNDRQQLFLLEIGKQAPRIKGELTRISESCNPQFWGWRGTRLLFGDTTKQPADLLCLDTADRSRGVEQLVTAPHWESAPSIRTVSPDGQTYICLVMEINGEGRLEHEVWKIKLERDAKWELLTNFVPSER